MDNELKFFEIIKSIIFKHNDNWVRNALIIILFFIGVIVVMILKNFNSIKKNWVEFRKWMTSLNGWQLSIVGICFVLFVIGIFAFTYYIKKSSQYQEIVIKNEQNEIVYPIGADILQKEKIGDYIFFTYDVTQKVGTDIITYPALFKWTPGKVAERISTGACPHFEIAKNSIIYLKSTFEDLSHGKLFIARPDGINKRVIEEEIYNFSIENNYIYFVYCFDTVGVGLDGHALHRMELNGKNIVTVSYELSSPSLEENHYDFKVQDGWAVYSNYKIQIQTPADGLEKVVLLENTDEDWIYYTSNRLIKAKPDGSKQIVLDDIDDFWYQINKIENGKIYYQKGNNQYRIDIDGKNKVQIK